MKEQSELKELEINLKNFFTNNLNGEFKATKSLAGFLHYLGYRRQSDKEREIRDEV